MNSRVKKDWLTALRSGKYKQGKGRLCSTKGRKAEWCCLGVLIDVGCDTDWYSYGVIDGKEWWGVRDPDDSDSLETHTLTDRIRDKFDLPLCYIGDLILMNDSEKQSFLQIADWIEERL